MQEPGVAASVHFSHLSKFSRRATLLARANAAQDVLLSQLPLSGGLAKGLLHPPEHHLEAPLRLLLGAGPA